MIDPFNGEGGVYAAFWINRFSTDQNFRLVIDMDGDLQRQMRIPSKGLRGGKLTVRRENGVYTFSCNDKPIYTTSIPELDGTAVRCGARHMITSAAHGVTASMSVDNWDFVGGVASAPETPTNPPRPELYSYRDDFSFENSLSNYLANAYVYPNATTATASLAYSITDAHAFLTGEGGFSDVTMRRADGAVIPPDQNFEFSADVHSLSEYVAGVWLSDVAVPYSEKNCAYVRFWIDSWRNGQLIRLQLSQGGKQVWIKDTPSKLAGGNLSVRRVSGGYTFSCNGETIYTMDISEISQSPLYFGTRTQITSAARGVTARMSIDNWDFKIL
jgi:hypothetical protein